MKIDELPLWEILVPHKMGKHDNTDSRLHKSNRNIQVPYHQEWDKDVRNIVGGLTIQKAAVGHWVNKDGKVFKEIMIPVRIACTEEQIKRIAELTLWYYAQEAVMVTLISEKTLIFNRK